MSIWTIYMCTWQVNVPTKVPLLPATGALMSIWVMLQTWTCSGTNPVSLSLYLRIARNAEDIQPVGSLSCILTWFARGRVLSRVPRCVRESHSKLQQMGLDESRKRH